MGWSIVHELCESQGGRPGLAVLTSPVVSVDVKLWWTMLTHWSQLVPNTLCQPTSEDIKHHLKKGGAYSEGTDFGIHERKTRGPGGCSTETSSAWSFKSLTAALRKSRISCSLYGRRAMGTREIGNHGLFWHCPAACENWADEYNNFYALGKFGQDRKTFSKVLLYHLTNLVLVGRPRRTDT